MAEICHEPLSYFLQLPVELIDLVLTFLPPLDILVLSQTSSALRRCAHNEQLWKRLILENAPYTPLQSPFPFTTFKDLFVAHLPHWFVAKHKIWFGDTVASGKIMLTKFDGRRGCIEGYQLLGEKSNASLIYLWQQDPPVWHQEFEPSVRIVVDSPLLYLEANPSDAQQPNFTTRDRYFNDGMVGLCETFCLTRALPKEEIWKGTPVWPPHNIPATQRVRNPFGNGFLDPKHRPTKISEISDQTFRIKSIPSTAVGAFTHYAGRLRVSLWNSQGGHSNTTYSTLLHELYTPTKDKPWRGIWVGDYAGHGCEFVLVHQPEEDGNQERDMFITQSPSRLDSTGSTGLELNCSGRLEAIKLTGDPNIPRGEYTFLCEDIGPKGFLRTESRHPFQGARVVSSQAHTAAQGFREGPPLCHHCSARRVVLIHYRRVFDF